MNDLCTKPLAPTVQVVLVSVPSRLCRCVERTGNLGPLVAGFAGRCDGLLHRVTQLLAKAVPIGHGRQRVARWLGLREIGVHLAARFVSVAGAFIQSASKVIHSEDESTQSGWRKSTAVSIDRKQYLRDDQGMGNQIDPNQRGSHRIERAS